MEKRIWEIYPNDSKLLRNGRNGADTRGAGTKKVAIRFEIPDAGPASIHIMA
jgi:hypothetical protein